MTLGDNSVPEEMSPVVSSKPGAPRKNIYIDAMKADSANWPRVESGESVYLSSSPAKLLNEANSEYEVTTVKHFFNDSIVVQYRINNTIEDQQLSDLKIQVISLDTKSEGLVVSGIVNLPEGQIIKHKSKAEEPSFVYVTVDKRNCADALPLFSISNNFTFTITEIDIDNEEEVGSYEDDYDIPDVSVTSADYIRPHVTPNG
jgi:coatomer protein complex subunit gamma